MSERTPNRHKVQPDDALRLNRLSEEVRSRLTEMAFIAARTTGAEYDGGTVNKFVPREAMKAKAAEASSDYMELIEIVPGFDCCYGTIAGESFFECPCA